MLGRKDAVPTALASMRVPCPGAEMGRPVSPAWAGRQRPHCGPVHECVAQMPGNYDDTGRTLGRQPVHTVRNEIANRYT